jgi:hypothetical protein
MGDGDERTSMDDGTPIAAIEELLAVKGEHWRRTATLLTGGRKRARTCCRRRWSACSGAGGRSAIQRATCGARCTPG